MKRCSFLSLILISGMCMPSVMMHAAPQKMGPTPLPIQLPDDALAEEPQNLKAVVEQIVHTIIQQVYGAASPAIAFGQQEVRIKAQEFLAAFDEQKTLTFFSSTTSNVSEADFKSILQTLPFLACITPAQQKISHTGTSASPDELIECITDHTQKLRACVSRCMTMTQDMTQHLEAMLTKLSGKAPKNQNSDLSAVIEYINRHLTTSCEMLEDTMQSSFHQCIVYTTALWLAHKSSKAELQDYLQQQEKQVILQILTPFLHIQNVSTQLIMQIAQSQQPQQQ